MKLSETETIMLKDAIVEHWHQSMKHSKNEKLREQYRSMMVDVKTITSTRGKTFTITLKT